MLHVSIEEIVTSRNDFTDLINLTPSQNEVFILFLLQVRDDIFHSGNAGKFNIECRS